MLILLSLFIFIIPTIETTNLNQTLWKLLLKKTALKTLNLKYTQLSCFNCLRIGPEKTTKLIKFEAVVGW